MGRGLGCCLDPGSSSRVFHVLSHPSQPRRFRQMSASGDPVALQPTHPQVVWAVGTAVTGAGGHSGMAALGLVQAGCAHVWAGAPTWSLGMRCP